jgi:hypothetical protein
MLCLWIALLPFAGLAWEAEDIEEPAGATCGFLLNVEDDIYGLRFGDGTWIKHTPIFGDYFMRIMHSDLEDAWYSGIGMTIRIMPHWKFAPFIGAGGSYNYSLSGEDEEEEATGFVDPNEPAPEEDDDELPEQGENYWGGHAEAGIRIRIDNRVGLLELFGRYTCSALDGDHDYWLVGISTRPGL